MTTYEAIQRIQTHNEIHSRKEPNAVYITEALQMAIEALAIQTPQKADIHPNSYFYLSEFYCPSCKKFLGFVHTKHYKYCPECGQALDWSD